MTADGSMKSITLMIFESGPKAAINHLPSPNFARIEMDEVRGTIIAHPALLQRKRNLLNGSDAQVFRAQINRLALDVHAVFGNAMAHFAQPLVGFR